ncbi:protein of unknown function [Bradyrhizobium vignae]|uniref:Uncharacterized protein n=1 Tax=Bradyrhizobium vignae TaxID=1549949 RepID=A0A2U3Q174_9BRAD|nr:protein of unknown function [Bradyrhizobium vignae]
MPLFCPTSQIDFAKSEVNDAAGKSLISLAPATVHGVVFAVFVFAAVYSAAFSLKRCA